MQKKEILTRKFSRAFTGYDIAEVDFFLDEVYREFSLMEHELEGLRTRLAAYESAARTPAEVSRPAAEARDRAEIPSPPPALALPAEGKDADSAHEADTAERAGFYFGQMYAQAEYVQTEEVYTEAEETAVFLIETEDPGYAFTGEDAAQAPQEPE